MSLSQDLIFLILQFCNEENLTKTAHMLGQETGVFFDMLHFEALVLDGNWDDTENYLSGFTSLNDNRYSMKMYFEIRKQKFLEALHSLNWQHIHCANPQPETEIKTLFTDHKCPIPEDQSVLQRPRPGKAISTVNPDYPQIFSNSSIITGDIASASTSTAVRDSGNQYDGSSIRDMNEKVLSIAAPSKDQDALSNLSDDFPKAVERVLTIGNPPMTSNSPAVNYSPTTMDFHPVQQTLLIVGDSGGGMELWDVSSGKKLLRRLLMIWEVRAVSPALLKSMGEDPSISVNSVRWSSDGSLIGVASSKSIVQLYYYHNNNNHVENHLEIEAHSGSVYDLAFYNPNNELLVITCGQDKLVKVWNANSGARQYTFEGHGAPVYSLCAHEKENIPASPCVRFNKHGTLLAVSVDPNRVKILANDWGRILLQTSLDTSRYPSIRELADYSLSGTANTTSTDDIVPLEKTADNQTSMEHNKILGNQSISKVVQISRCESLRLPSEVKSNKVWRLMYTHAGNMLVALVANGIHLLWKWSESDSNLTGQATTKCTPQVWQPQSRQGWVFLTNSLPSSDAGAVSPCLALTKNDFYAISASGGAVSIFNMLMFKKMRSIMPPTPAATCIACHPSNYNVIAVGMDDSTIIVYNVRLDEVISRLKGHSKRITGLAFSNILNVLVSSGADSQIVVWNSTNWDGERSTVLQISADWVPTELSETSVEFQQDEKHFLVVHETQIAIYETTKLACVKQWIIKNFCARISHATLSCDGQWIYAVMKDGLVLILSASDLSPKYEIDPSTFLTSDFSPNVFPLVVAAHPQNPNQIALGLNDGGVVIVESPESDGRWLVIPQGDNSTKK